MKEGEGAGLREGLKGGGGSDKTRARLRRF